MSIANAWQGVLQFLPGRMIVVEPSAGQLSSDAGLLPIRAFDEHLGWTRRFADVLNDPRAPAAIDHPFLEMVRSRVFGILADYEDQNDHDVLRHDPVFKMLANRAPDADPLASQPTLSRFENAIDIPSLWRLRDVLIDQFLDAFTGVPTRLTFDLDAVDDAVHGQQQLALFHGYYEQYQYYPLVITSADTDAFVGVMLRFGTAAADLGADAFLDHLVTRVRQRWPDVRILIRGDAGFGTPHMYAVCERLGLDYTFGLSTNAVLKQRSDAVLADAVRHWEATGEPQRRFTAFSYQAGSWPIARWVVAKAETHAEGINRRFVVTNRPGAFLFPDAAYDEYVERGESENRNKEFKCDMAMDRTSDHRFLANYFRLYLHALALNLLVRLRREIAAPPPPSEVPTDLPAEALAGADRRRHFRHRRRADPLGEGQPCTWRTHVIKVAAEVVTTTRRILIRLAGNWPHLDHYRRLCEHLAARPVPSLCRSD